MSLWGNNDTANDAPKFLDDDELADTYFVDTDEATVEANRAKGIRNPGWTKYTTYTDCNGNTRHKSENLVVVRRSAAEAGDEGTSANTSVEDSTVSDS